MMKIGDTVVPKGCSSEYQQSNKMVINHLKTVQTEIVCDGEPTVMEYQVASKNGWSWFPLSTLEKWEVNHDLL